MTQVRDLLEAFATDRRGDGQRPAGITEYVSRLRRFDRWLKGRTVDQLSWVVITDYRNELAQRCAVSTVETMMVSIRAFCRWAVERGHLAEDVSAKVRVPRRPKALPKPLNPDELAALWAALTADARVTEQALWVVRRNRLVVSLMYYAGLRLSEVSRLIYKDCSTRTRTITVRDSKSGDRAIPMHPELVIELLNWPEGKRHDPVVRSWRGGGMTAGGVAHIFEVWLPERGVFISAHRLRHSFATEYLRATKDLRGLMTLMGHRSLETTQIYTEVLGDEQRANIAQVPALKTF
jgi:site-specific recombinase XerD